MTKEELLIKFAKILKEDDILKASGIHEDNFKPHQFTVGKQHALAADENDGVMTEEMCTMYPCEAKGCDLSYEEHDSDKRLVLQLKRNVSQNEANEQLVKLKPMLKKLEIASLAFADTDEGFKFI